MFAEEIKQATILLVIAQRHADERRYSWALSHWTRAAKAYLLSGNAKDAPDDGGQIRSRVADALICVHEKIERLQAEAQTTSRPTQH